MARTRFGRRRLPSATEATLRGDVGEASEAIPTGEGEVEAVSVTKEPVELEEQEAEEDCDGDDAEEEEAEEENLVPVEENAAEKLASHFGDIARGDVESDDSDDEMWKEDALPDPLSSDEEVEQQPVEKEQRQPDGEVERQYEENESPDEILALGKLFTGADEFKKALLRYSLKTRYDIKLYMSEQKKCGAVCSDKEGACSWKVYCSYEKSKRKMQIKIYESNHNCIRSGYSKLLKSSTIAQLFEERLRLSPKLTAVEMAAEIKRRYNLIVTDEQCRKAKTKLTRARRKTHEEHFARIWDYEAELHKTNIGTITDIQTIPGAQPGSKQRFDRFYVCFQAQRIAWKDYCRPIIGLDGAFLKWDVKGQLLAAVGRDGDNRIMPIAWVVVEIENDVNWDWFVNHLKIDLGLGEGKDFAIISDKQKGLVKAVHNQLPEAEHRMCARHILGNWKRDNHDPQLERLFWKIARSYTKGDYEDNLLALRQCNRGAYDNLLRTNPPSWSRAFFKVGTCCNDILNNLSESFNKTIRKSRKKPLLELLEDIRRQCMVRTTRRFAIASRLTTKFTKSTHSQIESAIEKSRDCVRYMSTDDLHEVRLHGCSYRVDMRSKECGCRRWQLNGIPCLHVASVIIGMKRKVDDYVGEYFTRRTWKNTFRHAIQPVEGTKLWPRLNRLPVFPPPNRLGKAGRPSNYARRKSINEASSTTPKSKLSRENRIMTCSNCKVEGHNKSSCKNPSVEPPAKRPRDRPRKTPVSEGASEGGSQVA